ncbi:DUF4328 domain-containing protein [Rhodococcus oryzae]|uniref:DUF4328 domain-containing protein n=1 Tax=Rhodococcus oryzae TaxID=2571143 RepID=UPI00371691E9
MSTVQVCARCAARWPVVGGPAQWCPRCHGVLLSPTDPARPEPPNLRNFRWVARRPGAATSRVRPARTPAQPGPPSYREIPRWGLRDVPPAPDREPVAGRREQLAELAPALLSAAAALFALAALAELFRYGLLLRNRSTLIGPGLLAVSDGLVSAAGLLAPIVGVCAAVATVAWLVGARRHAFANRGHVDPRRPSTLALGCLVPVVNLAMPGVFLTELDEPDPQTRKLFRVWWVTWACGGVLFVVNLWWRTRDSLQAQADGVLLAAVTDLVAVAVAVLTLLVIHRAEGLSPTGKQRELTRWLVAVPESAKPATPAGIPGTPETPEPAENAGTPERVEAGAQ